MAKKHITKHKPVRTMEDDFYLLGLILSAAAVLLSAASRLWPDLWKLAKMPPCFFHLMTGYFCPGCGGTRAVRALLGGHVVRSFFYHPLVPYGAAVFLCFMTTQTIERISRGRVAIGMRYRGCYVWTAAAILIINCAVKNMRL